MAQGEQKNKRLGRAVFFLIAVFFASSFLYESFASERVKRHFLSWESLNRPDEYRRMGRKPTSLLRFKVSKDRISRLKKSSFWNMRPYQFSTPLVVDKRLYVGTDSGWFYAFDTDNKKRLWRVKLEGPVHGKSAFASDTVYVGDSKAFVYALDALTGGEKWRTHLDTEILASPLMLGARLYISDMSGRLYALDASSGAEIWHTESFDRTIGFSVRRASAPLDVNGTIIVGTATGALIAYAQSDGQVAWVRQLGDRQSQVYDVDSSPLFAQGRLYASSADGMLFCLDPASGQVHWSVDAGGVDDLLYRDGRIYASGSGVLSAVDASLGNIIWQQDLKVPEISSPAAGERYVVVTSTDEKLYIIDSDNGDVVYDRYVSRGTFGDPVVVDDRLFLLTNSSKLYSFRLKELPPKKKKR